VAVAHTGYFTPMKPPKFDMLRPESLGQLVGILDADEDARVISGGQSLMPMLNFRIANPPVLVDISRLSELRGIELEPGSGLRIGATTTHREIERSDLVKEHQPFLPYALQFVAHVAIRNKGTIGGSLAHADPSAEWPALCLLCEAEVETASVRGCRRLRIDDFLVGTFATNLEPGEVVVAIRFPAWNNQRLWGFQEVSRRHGDFAIAGAAVWLERDATSKVTAARIVVFAVEDRPVALHEVAESLVGKVPDERHFAEAGRLAASTLTARGDLHASAEYRSELVEVMVERALCQAVYSIHKGKS